MRNLLCIAIAFFAINLHAQDIEKKWQLESGQQEISTLDWFQFSDSDYLKLSDGKFIHTPILADSNFHEGDYLYQNNLLIFYYSSPKDTIINYKVAELTDSTLVLRKNYSSYKFKRYDNPQTVVSDSSNESKVIPSKGFSFQSFWRGVLGMISLLFIAFLFSSNRKAIQWKTVGLGLVLQLIIAIGVLRIPFVQKAFDFVGQIFVSILDFTRAGSKFLFEGLVVDMDTFGFIFAFQVLPTIIFFSALTSLLFYMGIIQKAVKIMALLLTKILGISGAESLSVAGNIF